MFFLFGWGRKSKEIGQTLMVLCRCCGKQGRWVIVKQFRYFSLFFIPVVQYDAKWLHVCPTCRRGQQVDKAQAQQLLNGESQ